MENWHQALNKFVAELRTLYGERLRQVMLYGSRARGDAEPGSDIDTLVILDPLSDFWEEFSRISPIASRISLEFDIVISALPIDAEQYERAETPLLMNTHREGVLVG